MPYHAILFYRSAVTVNPFDSRMWMALGECYQELGEKENSIRCYQRAVCNSDSEGSAIFRLAKLYVDTGDPNRASFCYESFIDNHCASEDNLRKEESAEAVEFLAVYFFEKGIYDKAERYAQLMMYNQESVAKATSLLQDLHTLRHN
jgi:anaphase-promoting complex subunit 8